MILVQRVSLFILLTPWCIPAASAQSAPPATQPGCEEAPREDALVSECLPSSFSEEDAPPSASEFYARISLRVPHGTPLRIALDQRTRVDHPGEVVHGKVVETVYAFDQHVIPAGSIVSGRILSINPVSGVNRTLADATGTFSPLHQHEV